MKLPADVSDYETPFNMAFAEACTSPLCGTAFGITLKIKEMLWPN